MDQIFAREKRDTDAEFVSRTHMSLGLCHPVVLKVLSVAYRVRDAYRRRRSDSRRAGEHRAHFYAELWRDAAAHYGASIEPLGNEILQIRLGQACTRVWQNTTAMDSAATVLVARNKPVVHRLLAARGLRVPTYLEFTLDEVAKAV